MTSACYNRGEARTSPYLRKRDDGSCYFRRSIPLRSALVDHSQKTTMAGKAVEEKEAVPAVRAGGDVGKRPIKTAAFPQGG